MKRIKKIKKEHDIVIDCLHIGGQYNETPNSYTKKIVKKSLKTGVDVISCNHEHVIHPIKCYGKQIVSYSLGNFLGTNGVLEEPFDKKSDVSIGLNLYIDKYSKAISCSYSLYKTLKNDGKCYTELLFNLLQKEPNNSEFMALNNYYTNYLSGRVLKPAQEYWIEDSLNE